MEYKVRTTSGTFITEDTNFVECVRLNSFKDEFATYTDKNDREVIINVSHIVMIERV